MLSKQNDIKTLSSNNSQLTLELIDDVQDNTMEQFLAIPSNLSIIYLNKMFLLISRSIDRTAMSVSRSVMVLCK